MSHATPDAVKPSAPARRTVRPLLQLFVGAVIVHLVLVVALSPGLFSGEDTSPEGLVERARKLADEQKYADAVALYEKVRSQRPPVPAIFDDAEKELQDARRKLLQQQQQQQTATPSPEGQGGTPSAGQPGGTTPGGEKPPTPAGGEKPPAGGGGTGTPPTPGGPLPALPDLDGGL